MLKEVIAAIDVNEVKAWAQGALGGLPPLVYSSFDTRFSGFKVATVDANLFPGGFNNLTQQAKAALPAMAQDSFLKPGFFDAYIASNPAFQNLKIRKVLLIAEGHTRNINYVRNIKALGAMLTDMGCEVRLSSIQIGDISFNVGEDVLQYYKLEREGEQIGVSGMSFIPDVILLNADLTNDDPAILQGISQPVLPPLSCGWNNRVKSSFFDEHTKTVEEFCRAFNIADPWWFNAFHANAPLDFQDTSSIEAFASKLQDIQSKTQERYSAYNINRTPSIFIKAENGTYGLGIAVINSIDSFLSHSKDLRKKLKTIRGGKSATRFVMQEAIPTASFVDSSASEHVFYFFCNQPCGVFLRQNANAQSLSDDVDNLNKQGVRFVEDTFQPSSIEHKSALISSLISSVSLAREVKSLIA